MSLERAKERLEAATYEFTFAVWPNESRWERAVYQLFQFQTRQSHDFTEAEFTDFQASLERSGFTLREVEKRLSGLVAEHAPADLEAALKVIEAAKELLDGTTLSPEQRLFGLAAAVAEFQALP